MKLAKFALVMSMVVGLMLFSVNVIHAATESEVWCGSGGFWGNKASSVMSDNPTVNTALGCIPIKPVKFVEWLLPWVFGVGGGISFLLMVYGFFLMTTSSGDPKAVQGAQETITSAITGLLVSIFALFLMRLISIGILQIPGIQ